MKILYIHPYNNYTGSTKVMADVLKSKYSDLSNIVMITETSQEGFFTGLGLKLINVPILRHNGRAIPLLSKIVWVLVGFFKVLYYVGDYDAVYINTILPGYAAIAARLRGRKVIYHVHELWVKKNLKSWFGELVFNHTKSHRIYVSQYVASNYPKRDDCTEEIIYNKLGKDFMDKVERIAVGCHNRRRILMLASLQRGKGIDMFLETAKLLPNYDFTLVISSEDDLIKKYFCEGYPSNVTILPKQSNVHKLYRQSDIILNLSNPNYCVETFGLTIIEGMAYGLPAIVPNAGGPMEVVENGNTGYVIDVTNAENISKYIVRCTEKSEYERMYNNCLKRLEMFKY